MLLYTYQYPSHLYNTSLHLVRDQILIGHNGLASLRARNTPVGRSVGRSVVGKIGPGLTKGRTNKMITRPCDRGLGQANKCFENHDRSSFRLARRYECGFVPSLSVGPRHTGSNKLSLHDNYNAVRVKLHCHHECYAGEHGERASAA